MHLIAWTGFNQGPLPSIVLFTLGLLWPLSHQAAEPGAPKDLDSYLVQSGYESIQFKRNPRNQPLVPAQLNGKNRGFLIDTGCGMTTLEPEGAAGLKTLGERGVTLQDSFFGTLTNASIVLMDKLVFGRAEFLNQPAKVTKLDMDFIRLQFDGILGLDFMFRNFCLIDCYRHRLYLLGHRPSKDQSRDLTELLRRSGFCEVPIEAHPYLSVDALIEGKPVVLLVDTGDSITTLDQSAAKRLRVSFLKRAEPETGSHIQADASGMVVGFNSIGSHQLRIASLGTLEIGARTWHNVPCGVANLNDWELSKAGGPETKIEGMYGVDQLAVHGALIDIARRKLWFRPEKPAGQ